VARGLHAAQLKVFAVVSTAYLLTTCPYFDNLKSYIFDAVVLNATLSRLYCVLRDFHIPTGTLVQDFFLVFCFLPLLLYWH